MLVPLTLRLIAVPELAWPRLAAAEARGEDMPSPLSHASMVAGITIALTLLGAVIKVDRSVGGVALATLLAVAGYLGSAAAAVLLSPLLIRTNQSVQGMVPRFASAVAIPAIACGAVNLIPLGAIVVLGAIFGAVLSYRSGSLGARDFLGMEGAARQRATLTIAALASTPIVITASLRILL